MIIDFNKAFHSDDLEEFLNLVFPVEYINLKNYILNSGVKFSDKNTTFCPGWTHIPLTIKNGDTELETQVKSVLFRVHDCIHQLYTIIIPKDFNKLEYQIFENINICGEIASFGITEFLYAEYVYKTQSRKIKEILNKRNTLLFKKSTILKNLSIKEISIKIYELLYINNKPNWIKNTNNYAKIFLKDCLSTLKEDKQIIKRNWNLLKEQEDKQYLNDLNNSSYAFLLNKKSLLELMLDNFNLIINTPIELNTNVINKKVINELPILFNK